MFDIVQSNKNNDGGHSIVASFLSLEDLDATSWPGLIASPTTNGEAVTLDTGDIVAKSTKKWIKVSTEIEMNGAALSSEGSPGSLSLVGAPVIKFNNLTEEELGFVKNIKNKQGLWVLKDMAGTQWCYGTPDLPAKLQEMAGDMGRAIADDKFLEFTIRSVQEPAVYPGAISYAAVV